MKKIISLAVIGALGLSVFGGCAKDSVVKKDEAIAPSTTQAKQPEVKPVNTIQKAPQATPNSIKPAMEQMKSELDKIYFDFDSSTLSEQSRKTLTANADYIKKNASANVRIEGNCDERGSAEYNLALGEKRAKTAKKYLVTMGIPESRLSVISFGKEKPADQGHDESAWAKNRRDEFSIVSK